MDVHTLDKRCNLFDLTNLIKTETCFTKNHKPTIDLFLTNRLLSVQKYALLRKEDSQRKSCTFYQQRI